MLRLYRQWRFMRRTKQLHDEVEEIARGAPSLVLLAEVYDLVSYWMRLNDHAWPDKAKRKELIELAIRRV